MTDWQPQNALASAVYAAGFAYDPSQDIIYSRMDALQRDFGYAYGYDKSALLMSAAIDCEPIFFDYAGKTWMIELWKGQYGLETGCEIGIYNRDRNDNSISYDILDPVIGRREEDPNPEHSLFFKCASDDEMLSMSFTLYRNGEEFFTRGPERHWWLTGFKWGVYSGADELAMHIKITFEQKDMLDAFTQALAEMGYQPDVTQNSPTDYLVSFVFDRPTTYQPRLDSPLLDPVNSANQGIVDTYKALDLSQNDPNQIPEEAWDMIEPGILKLGSYFMQVLNNAIADLGDWAKTVLGLLGSLFTIDDSCAVEIVNQSSILTLFLSDKGIDTYKPLKYFGPTYDLGYFQIEPPNVIAPGNVGRFYVKDNPLLYGAEGWVSYKLADADGNSQPITFSFGCPEFEDNHASISPPNDNIFFLAKTGDGSTWGDKNAVPTGGHPLLVRFVIGS